MNFKIIIIFGITGDLAKRKLIPALYQLIKNGTLEQFFIFGIGKEIATKEQIFERSHSFIEPVSQEITKQFFNNFFYLPLNIQDPKSFFSLVNDIENIEKSKNITNNSRIVYCATAANLFIPITLGIAHAKIIRRQNHIDLDYDKIVYEKPFGNSKHNAHEINSCIEQFFEEKQIFRVDHYLSKELVRTLLNIRFSNSFFETQLNNKHVEQVHIIAHEKIGIEGRTAYYDSYGAIKDMVQNHLLSLFALLTLEQPEKFDCKIISKNREQILKNIIFEDGIRGQCIEYKQEPGIPSNSNIETFAALVFYLQNDRWHNVPFYVETGKYLAQKETSILIKFKTQGIQQSPNYFTIQIAPKSRLTLSLHLKSPVSRNELVTVPMEFSHSTTFGSETSEAYESLLHDIFLNEHWSSISREEIECAWDIAEKITEKNLPLISYKKGSNGPKKDRLIKSFKLDLK